MGVCAGAFDIASAVAFLVLAYICLPVYRASHVFTLPEWAARRFPGQPLRAYLSCTALLLYVVSKTAVALYCGALLLEAVLGIDGAQAVGGLLLLTCSFSLLGGLAAVIVVEVLNTGLLLAGGVAAAALALRAVGGWAGLRHAIATHSAAADAAGLTRDFVHLRQPAGALYSLPALLLGAPWAVLWYHCADQEMVQRGLAARSLPDARLGSVVAGLLKLAVPWMFAAPGVAARLLYPTELGCAPGSPGAPCTRADLAYPAVMVHLLPSGLLGVVLAAALAGVMSVLASTFNSASTIFATDVYRRCRPRTPPGTLVWVGRAWIVCMTAAAVLWLPLLSRLSPSLYLSMQLLNSALAPPIVVVFAAALLWPRANATGALCCLLLGHTAGLLRLLLGAALPAGSPALAAADPLLGALASVNFLLWSAAVGGLSVATLVAASLLTAPPPAAAVQACTHPAVLALCARLRSSSRRSPAAPQQPPPGCAPPPPCRAEEEAAVAVGGRAVGGRGATATAAAATAVPAATTTTTRSSARAVVAAAAAPVAASAAPPPPDPAADVGTTGAVAAAAPQWPRSTTWPRSGSRRVPRWLLAPPPPPPPPPPPAANSGSGGLARRSSGSVAASPTAYHALPSPPPSGAAAPPAAAAAAAAPTVASHRGSLPQPVPRRQVRWWGPAAGGPPAPLEGGGGGRDAPARCAKQGGGGGGGGGGGALRSQRAAAPRSAAAAAAAVARPALTASAAAAGGSTTWPAPRFTPPRRELSSSDADASSRPVFLDDDTAGGGSSLGGGDRRFSYASLGGAHTPGASARRWLPPPPAAASASDSPDYDAAVAPAANDGGTAAGCQWGPRHGGH